MAAAPFFLNQGGDKIPEHDYTDNCLQQRARQKPEKGSNGRSEGLGRVFAIDHLPGKRPDKGANDDAGWSEEKSNQQTDGAAPYSVR